MKIIKHVHVVKLYVRKFIVLYSDGTWEELFQFTERNGGPKINGALFLRKTRTEAIEIYYQRTGIKIEN